MSFIFDLIIIILLFVFEMYMIILGLYILLDRNDFRLSPFYTLLFIIIFESSFFLFSGFLRNLFIEKIIFSDYFYAILILLFG